jgi:hypothetical protein
VFPLIIDTDITDEQNYKDNHESANMNLGQLDGETLKSLCS